MVWVAVPTTAALLLLPVSPNQLFPAAASLHAIDMEADPAGRDGGGGRSPDSSGPAESPEPGLCGGGWLWYLRLLAVWTVCARAV